MNRPSSLPAVQAPAASTDELRELAAAGLFDAEYYLAANPDVARIGADPLVHFQLGGWRESRAPNPYFDLGFYRDQAPEAFDDPAGPLLHYVRRGEAEGGRASPWFDAAWFRTRHDVPAGTTALAYFLRRRHSGTVSPNADFDPQFYLQSHPDVAAAGIDPFLHFREMGRKEGRLPRPAAEFVRGSGLFDENFYLVQNADVREAGLDPIAHFLETGWRERRYPNPFFNPDWYAATYDRRDLNPLVHYALVGEAQGARPSLAFDPAWYRRTYAIPAHQSPLGHYLAHRRGQKHSPLPLFDVDFYMEGHGARIGPNRDPFVHYLLAGAAQDLDPNPFFRTGPYRRHHMGRDGAERAGAPARAELENPLLHFLATFVLAGAGPER